MREARARLYGLIEEGAQAFDEPNLRYIEALLSRIEGDSALGERLLPRIAARFEAVEASMRKAREEAESVHAEIAGVCRESADEVRRLIDAGHFREAKRLGKSRLRSFDPEAEARLFQRIATILEQFEAHNLQPPSDLRQRLDALHLSRPLGPSAFREGRILAFELSTFVLETILTRSRGSALLTRIRSRTHLPEQIGPYNPQAVATHTLDLISRLSPEYLGVWLRILDELQALERLLPKPAAAPKKRKR